MPTAKKLAVFAAVGALLGFILMTLVVPKYLAWDNTPAFGQALCDCTRCAHDTAARVVQSQLVGGAVGAIIGALLGAVVMMRKRKNAAPPPAAPPAATA